MARPRSNARRERQKDDKQRPRELQATAAKAAFDAFVDHPQFPCLGAKSIVHRAAYEFCFLPALNSDAAALALHERLVAYLGQFDGALPPADLNSFVACFAGPREVSEKRFERLLWEMLQELHEIDAQCFSWAPDVDIDPSSPNFSYSIGGVAFFLVGMSPRSSRMARRFPWPAIAFNFHGQFSDLREQGTWETMQAAIRQRDIALQGSINPELRDHGGGSQARQYSGCPHAQEDWTPNFRPLKNDESK